MLRVWPTYEGAAEKYTEAFTALPTLDVAVLDVPRPTAPWVRSPAAERVAKLLYLPILANESEDAVRGKLVGQIASSLEIGDIGKKLEIRLKPTEPVWSDGTRPVGAIDVVRALTDRAQPRSPGYSARWADLLDRVEVSEDQAIIVKLTRPILKPEAWLLNPVGPAHAAWDGRVSNPDGTRRPVGDGPFISESETDELCTYQVNKTAVVAPDPAKLTRLREVRLPTAAAIVAALTRGEVSLVEHLPPDRVNGLRQNPEIKVGSYNQVSLHRLAIDGRNPILRNRNLRRGLAYAIDRRAILEETLLRRTIDGLNGASDGPMANESYANAPNVAPYRYDPSLARMLVAAGKTEMKSGPVKLTLEYPAIPRPRPPRPGSPRCIAPSAWTSYWSSGPRPSWKNHCDRAGSSSWRIAARDALSRSGRSVPCSAPASTPPRRARASRPWLARGSCSSCFSWSRCLIGIPPRNWSCRSIANAATSCRSSPSGSSRTISLTELA